MTNEACKSALTQTIDQSKEVWWFKLRFGRITASKLYEIAHCKTPQGSSFEVFIPVSPIGYFQSSICIV